MQRPREWLIAARRRTMSWARLHCLRVLDAVASDLRRGEITQRVSLRLWSLCRAVASSVSHRRPSLRCVSRHPVSWSALLTPLCHAPPGLPPLLVTALLCSAVVGSVRGLGERRVGERRREG